jgi:hypothetical protein
LERTSRATPFAWRLYQGVEVDREGETKAQVAIDPQCGDRAEGALTQTR